jgi:Putative prokaryotic signal transducing protein/zinc-ribbon domain
MARGPAPGDQLSCPACGQKYSDQERFCPDCGLPLVQGGERSGVLETVGERHQRARKIKPQLTEGRLVRVVGARNQAEAEFIQGLLLEEGVPSMLRRSAGFDVPDFLAAGPRDILVPESALATAREVLLEGELISDEPAPRVVAPGRLLAGLLIALALGALVVWLLSQL